MRLILIYLQKKIIVLNKIIPLTIIALFFTFKSNAQHLTNGVGVFYGTAFMLGDFEQENNFQNTGSTITISHYLHFFNNNRSWNSNSEVLNKVAIKTNFNYTSISLINKGEYSNRNNTGGAKLRAMKGNVTMMSFGTNLEYYLNDLGEFLYPYNDNASFNPFITLGFRYSMINNEISSDYGAGYNSSSDGAVIPLDVLAGKYYSPGAFETGSVGAFAVKLGLGTRYRITPKIDIAVQGGWQIYLNDNVDGIVLDEPANKFNDWTFSMQFGVIYHLNYEAPFSLF